MEKQTEAEAILQNNLDYTFFPGPNKQGSTPLMLKGQRAYIFMTVAENDTLIFPHN